MKMSNIKVENKEILLCCGRGRCPAIKRNEEENDSYIITDDFGGSIKLDSKQLNAISEALEKLNDI